MTITNTNIIKRCTYTALLLTPLCGHGDTSTIGTFSQGNMSGWQEKSFVGNTRYTLVKPDDKSVLRADAEKSASGLLKEIEIDLNKTPYLNWSWRVDNLLTGNNEQDKNGDDYPARVYVVVSGGLLFWRTRAINYVWSSRKPSFDHWPNAYTDNAMMLPVRTRHDPTGIWVNEKRNVQKDLETLFGERISTIHAVAIMTDTDNTGQKATAFYGDIFFSSD